MKFPFSVLVISSLLLAGCGKDDSEAPDSSPTAAPQAARSLPAAAGEHFLGRVDADAALVYANLQRMPQDVVDQAWQINEMSMASARSMLEQMAEAEEMPAFGRALLERAASLTSREGWEAAGLHANPMVALHSVGVFPFAELETGDDDAVARLISEIEQDLEQSLEQSLDRRDIDGVEVLWLGLGDHFGLALRHGGGSLTAAIIPDAAEMLARVAGRVDPVDAMQPATLQAFNTDHGFLPAGSGYVDWQRLVAILMAEDNPLLAMDDDGELQNVIGNPACVAEYRAFAAALPRLAFGYTGLSTQQQDFLIRQELSSPWAADLARVARAPVTLNRPLTGIFNFGLAFDLLAGRDFARKLVGGWVANPPACPSLRGIAEGAPAWQQALNQPIPPMVTNLHGLFLEGFSLDFQAGDVPEFGGILAFHMNNPQLLVGMAQMFSPAAAALQLQPGGEAQRVPPDAIPQLQDMNLDLWMAMGQSALGVAFGQDHVESVRQALSRTEPDDLLMSAQFDFDILLEVMDFALGTLEDMVDEDQLQDLELQRAQYQVLAEMYDKAAVRVRLSERGIDFISENTLR